MWCKNLSELEKLSPPPSKESVGKIDAIENARFSYNKKTYLYALLKTGKVEGHASEGQHC